MADLFFESGEEDEDDDDIRRPALETFFLYVRPFTATNSFTAVPTDSLTSGPVDLEVRLADAFARWAPLIALGRPRASSWGQAFALLAVGLTIQPL